MNDSPRPDKLRPSFRKRNRELFDLTVDNGHCCSHARIRFFRDLSDSEGLRREEGTFRKKSTRDSSTETSSCAGADECTEPNLDN